VASKNHFNLKISTGLVLQTSSWLQPLSGLLENEQFIAVEEAKTVYRELKSTLKAR